MAEFFSDGGFRPFSLAETESFLEVLGGQTWGWRKAFAGLQPKRSGETGVKNPIPP